MNTFPADESPATPDSNDFYDLVVLGGGCGGYATALRAAQLGLTVAMIEQGKLGGTCLHAGCIPTKALLHAAEVADTVKTAQHHGVRSTYDGVDLKAVNEYRDGIVSRLFRGLTGLVAHQGIELIEGRGRLVARNAVAVDGREVRGRNIVLATGSSPRTIPGLEVDGSQVITSDHALQLDYIPTSVVVLGGGVIGCEFASIWRSFGAEVTIVEALSHLVPLEDEEVSKQFERGFRRRKINFRLNSLLTDVDRDADGVRLTVEKDGKAEVLEAELLLIAVGRGPVTDGLGLAELGVQLDRGFIVTDDHLRTNVEGIYAVGDVVAGLQLAHRGFAHGIFAAEEIAGLTPTPVQDTGIPRVTYSDPEIASVGLTESAARQQGGEVSVVRYDLGGNGKSQILGTQGFVKLVQSGGRIVGAHLVGSRVSELIAEAQLWVNLQVDISDLSRLIHAHPTQNEAMGEAILAIAGKPLHAHS